MSQTLVIFSPESYSVSMTYDNMGGIVQKNQTASLNYPGYPGEKYNYYYTQGNTAHPHATSKVWDRRNHKQYTYGFDSNGNPTTTHEQYAPPLQGQPNPSGPIDLIQQNYWDEQNQLRGLWNLSGLHHYIYDADGQRLMKSSVPMSYSSVNAQQLQATNSITAQDYTVYVSAGLVYESNGGSTTYTKHYYAGPLRVASQIGSANPNYETHPLGGQIAPGGPANTTPESYGVAALSDLNTLLANYGMAVNANEPPQDILSMQVINDPDECRMFYGDDLIEENRCLCDNFPDIAIQQGIDCNPYTPIYWYHPDYIGNIEFVTDRTGQPYQHFYYAAFGDPMVSQHVGTGSFNSAYRFNAKEFDEETGNYYYGARYYQPKSSIWMGVDALATSYPGMNPYNFVKGNPIMAIDPDSVWVDNGRHGQLLFEGGAYYNKDGSEYTGKTTRFAKNTLNALNEISRSRTGGTMIQEISESDNNVIIKPGSSRFTHNSYLKSQREWHKSSNPYYSKMLQAGYDFEGGTGGTVEWNSRGDVLPTTSGGKIAPAIDLAHELAHAYDAIHGLMNFDKIEVFGVPGVKEIEKNEFQAVYRENLIRQELNMPLRTHYITNETTDGTFIKGLGPNMLDSSGKPKRPSWY